MITVNTTLMAWMVLYCIVLKRGWLMSGALFLIVQHQRQKLQCTPEDRYGHDNKCGSLRAGLIASRYEDADLLRFLVILIT